MGKRNEKVFELLESQNKKYKDLADAIGVSKSAITYWKKNGTDPTYEQCMKLAPLLGVSVEYLWNDDTYENSVEFVKKICKERNIPISRLEKECGFANGYISQLKKGTFPADRLKKIADFLNLPSDYILSLGKDSELVEESEVFEIDLNKLQGDRKQFAESLINIYLAGVYSDEETFNLIRKGLDADLDMVMALVDKNKRRD